MATIARQPFDDRQNAVSAHPSSVVCRVVRAFVSLTHHQFISRSNVLLKALVKAAAEPGFTLKNVLAPTIRDDEVLIRVKRAGVCGTDVHIYEWDAWAQGRVKPPTVIGHEFAGAVAQVGKLVTDVKQGDRVTAGGHIV